MAYGYSDIIMVARRVIAQRLAAGPLAAVFRDTGDSCTYVLTYLLTYLGEWVLYKTMAQHWLGCIGHTHAVAPPEPQAHSVGR
jgi:hypothetical protein